MAELNKTNPNECQFLGVIEAARYLRLGRSTLDRYRTTGVGPRYRKHGGKVVYKREDLDSWSDNRVYRDTGTRG